MINLDHLNDEEREIIEQVILRDENERLKEEERVRKLKSELHQLRKQGAVKTGGSESGNERVCHRCRKELGLIFDSGDICPKCNNKVCNDCQVYTPSGKKWLCTVCDKQLKIKLGSPNWVSSNVEEDENHPSLYGSQLVKAALENSRANSTVTSVADENESRRFYEDDLSYSDEESESYISEEQDPRKSPKRNVTFGSPHHKQASSDLETVSEESEEEEEEGSASTDHPEDGQYPRPFPYPYQGEYRGESKTKVEVEVYDENGSHVPSTPSPKPVINTTPRLTGGEWEQMLNGKLQESEKDKDVQKGHEDIQKMEKVNIQMEIVKDELVEENQQRPSQGMVTEKRVTEEEDPEDADMVVINYSDDQEVGMDENAAVDANIEDPAKKEAPSVSSEVNEGHQGTQTEGEIDVHIDVTDSMSHTIQVNKARTLPADSSIREPEAPGRSATGSFSKRETSGALAKIQKDDFRKASRTSLASLYSNADESYRLPVTGDVNFGTSYNYKTNTFEVRIQSCRDLVPVDSKRNRSNPYVKLYLLPDRSKHSKRKTSVKKSTINPVYSETLRYKIRQSELETRMLCVAVWHYDRFGHNLFLGEHLLSLDTIQFDDYSPRWHALAQRQRQSTSALTYTGDVLVAVMYEALSEEEEKDRSSRYHKGKKNKAPGRMIGGSLHVQVKEAKNLVGMKLGGTSSPVCKCYLLPDRTKYGKKKTSVKKNTCNPKWTDVLKFENVTRDSLLERCLEVTVWDYDSVGADSLMGGVRLGLGSGKSYGKAVDWMDSSGKEVTVWREMLKNPNHWVETTMTLRGNVGKTKK